MALKVEKLERDAEGSVVQPPRIHIPAPFEPPPSAEPERRVVVDGVPVDPEPPGLVADRNLYLDESKTIVVEEDDPAQRFGLVGAGGTIPHAEVTRLGLTMAGEKVVQSGAHKLKDTAEHPAKPGE